MTTLAYLIEQRRIVQNRLNWNIKLKKSEKIKLEEELRRLDRAIECVRMIDGDCQNGKE